MLNVDDLTAIFQLSVNCLLFVMLAIYVRCTHTWITDEDEGDLLNFGDDQGNHTMDQKLKKAGVAFNENSNDEENITRLDSTLRNTSASKQGIPARIQPIFDLDITAINSRDTISRKELSSILLKRNSSATDLRKRSAMGNSKIDETAEAILGIGQQTDDDGFKEAKN